MVLWHNFVLNMPKYLAITKHPPYRSLCIMQVQRYIFFHVVYLVSVEACVHNLQHLSLVIFQISRFFLFLLTTYAFPYQKPSCIIYLAKHGKWNTIQTRASDGCKQGKLQSGFIPWSYYNRFMQTNVVVKAWLDFGGLQIVLCYFARFYGLA